MSDDPVTEAVIFGKLPLYGDFIYRGFSNEERATLDDWLTASLAQARAQLGERFPELFDDAPPWQFAWKDETWTAGAMTPSVDSAGRRFPLLVGLRGVPKNVVATACEHCEVALFKAVASRCSSGELESQLEELLPARIDREAHDGWWRSGEPNSLIAQRLPPDIMSRMLKAVIGSAA